MSRQSRQADGRNALQRISLQLRGDNGRVIQTYRFLINPENYKEDHPQRATVMRTRSASVVEDYGPDLVKIKFGGTTGLRRDSNGRNGADRLFELQELLEKYSLSGHRIDETGNTPTELYFYNNTDGKRYVVHLDTDGFSIERSAERSLLYDYSISLIVLRETNQPNPRDVDEAALGNKFYETTSQAINPNSRTAVYRSAMTGLRREFP